MRRSRGAGDHPDRHPGQASERAHCCGTTWPSSPSASRTTLIHARWGKFNKFRYVLTNRHVSTKGRLQLFNAVITPTILFGLGSLPLSKRKLEEIDALQRKMLRSIIGWYRVEGEAWSDTMRRMKSGVQSALRQSPVTTWSEVYRRTQHSFGARIVKQNAWPLFAASWDPTRHNNFATQPKRKPGRPRVPTPRPGLAFGSAPARAQHVLGPGAVWRDRLLHCRGEHAPPASRPGCAGWDAHGRWGPAGAQRDQAPHKCHG